MLLLSPHTQTSAESQKANSNVMPRKAFGLASVPNCSLIIWEWRFDAFGSRPYKINFSPCGMDKWWWGKWSCVFVPTFMHMQHRGKFANALWLEWRVTASYTRICGMFCSLTPEEPENESEAWLFSAVVQCCTRKEHLVIVVYQPVTWVCPLP